MLLCEFSSHFMPVEMILCKILFQCSAVTLYSVTLSRFCAFFFSCKGLITIIKDLGCHAFT